MNTLDDRVSDIFFLMCLDVFFLCVWNIDEGFGEVN